MNKLLPLVLIALLGACSDQGPNEKDLAPIIANQVVKERGRGFVTDIEVTNVKVKDVVCKGKDLHYGCSFKANAQGYAVVGVSMSPYATVKVNFNIDLPDWAASMSLMRQGNNWVLTNSRSGFLSIDAFERKARQAHSEKKSETTL